MTIRRNVRRIAAMLALLCIMVSLSAAYAGTPKYRTGTHAKTYSTVRHSSALRPYYGGGHHTVSHGGRYYGSTDPHHRNGHYENWRSGNRYGVHKLR